jgi:hypothetical protein
MKSVLKLFKSSSLKNLEEEMNKFLSDISSEKIISEAVIPYSIPSTGIPGTVGFRNSTDFFMGKIYYLE